LSEQVADEGLGFAWGLVRSDAKEQVEPVAPFVHEFREIVDDAPRFERRNACLGHGVHVWGSVIAGQANWVTTNVLDEQDLKVRLLAGRAQ
jgi:hypothetical protein